MGGRFGQARGPCGPQPGQKSKSSAQLPHNTVASGPWLWAAADGGAVWAGSGKAVTGTGLPLWQHPLPPVPRPKGTALGSFLSEGCDCCSTRQACPSRPRQRACGSGALSADRPGSRPHLHHVLTVRPSGSPPVNLGCFFWQRRIAVRFKHDDVYGVPGPVPDPCVCPTPAATGAWRGPSALPCGRGQPDEQSCHW